MVVQKMKQKTRTGFGFIKLKILAVQQKLDFVVQLTEENSAMNKTIMKYVLPKIDRKINLFYKTLKVLNQLVLTDVQEFHTQSQKDDTLMNTQNIFSM